MEDIEKLMAKAEKLGLRVSLYKLLPASKRAEALRVDVARAEKRRKEEKDGANG